MTWKCWEKTLSNILYSNHKEKEKGSRQYKLWETVIFFSVLVLGYDKENGSIDFWKVILGKYVRKYFQVLIYSTSKYLLSAMC